MLNWFYFDFFCSATNDALICTEKPLTEQCGKTVYDSTVYITWSAVENIIPGCKSAGNLIPTTPAIPSTNKINYQKHEKSSGTYLRSSLAIFYMIAFFFFKPYF